jgi:hypothetical protein
MRRSGNCATEVPGESQIPAILWLSQSVLHTAPIAALQNLDAFYDLHLMTARLGPGRFGALAAAGGSCAVDWPGPVRQAAPSARRAKL